MKTVYDDLIIINLYISSLNVSLNEAGTLGFKKGKLELMPEIMANIL